MGSGVAPKKKTATDKKKREAPPFDQFTVKFAKVYAHMVSAIPERYMGGDRKKRRGAYTTWCYKATQKALEKKTVRIPRLSWKERKRPTPKALRCSTRNGRDVHPFGRDEPLEAL